MAISTVCHFFLLHILFSFMKVLEFGCGLGAIFKIVVQHEIIFSLFLSKGRFNLWFWLDALLMQKASKLITKRSSPMDGQLFLIKHLLILREQVILVYSSVSVVDVLLKIFLIIIDWRFFFFFPRLRLSILSFQWHTRNSISLICWSVSPELELLLILLKCKGHVIKMYIIGGRSQLLLNCISRIIYDGYLEVKPLYLTGLDLLHWQGPYLPEFWKVK